MSIILLLTISYSQASLGVGGSGDSMSAAPKHTEEVPKDVPDTDTQSAEEMADSMLMDFPLPDVEED